ncbi:MAG TPA: hypothetical protein VK470_07340, partial [Bacteroidota bacterium]|nr:hypothetical protein [Bacteroidota bacterium]
DEIELAWKFIDSIRAGWMEDHAPALTTYARGSWGPSEADDLLACEGHWWILGCMRQETNDLQTQDYTAGRE